MARAQRTKVAVGLGAQMVGRRTHQICADAAGKPEGSNLWEVLDALTGSRYFQFVVADVTEDGVWVGPT